MNVKNLPVFVLLLILTSCSSPQNNANTPESGFDLAGSDPAAIELADSIMAAMGGRANWEKIRFISWSFSGRRNLFWDKQTGRVRIESLQDSTIYLVNVSTGLGQVRKKGKAIADAGSLEKMLRQARSIWINDSYWLIMPFKLKANGVRLTYLGEDTLLTGGKCNVLDLTFNEKLKKPESRYRIYVDLGDNLVKQWSYFRESDNDSAVFTKPWDNYRSYEGVLLSGDRSDGSGPRNIRVAEELPDEIFSDF